MELWEIITGIGTLASIAAWIKTTGWKTSQLVYPLLTVIFAGTTGYLAFQNRELSRIESEAKTLAASWPTDLRWDADDGGKYRGIILRGLQFLEKYREQHPDSYGLVKHLAESSGVIEKVKSDEYRDELDEVSRLHEAAESIITLIRGLANLPVPR